MIDTTVTQAAVLDWPRFPQALRADFDCPAGPHDFLPRVTSRGTYYQFCRNCKRMKRRVEWPDTHSLYGIYGR